MPRIPEEVRAAVITDYQSGMKSYEIAAKYGWKSNSSVYEILRRAGVDMTRNSSNSRAAKVKRCPTCKKIIPADAKFCCYCATDVRSEKDLIAERLSKLLTLTSFLPENNRDEFADAIQKAAALLKK